MHILVGMRSNLIIHLPRNDNIMKPGPTFLLTSFVLVFLLTN